MLLKNKYFWKYNFQNSIKNYYSNFNLFDKKKSLNFLKKDLIRKNYYSNIKKLNPISINKILTKNSTPTQKKPSLIEKDEKVKKKKMFYFLIYLVK